ncbi:MAG: 6-pyruvoyl tetrahydropterin synthase family protein [Dehalococcoidia bacterium]|nr:6-pyruvoyl tetrahydropterin synthase family protein [Dehalococcoidia bacterium]
MKYKVSVQRNTLRFSAAHLTTFDGQAEPLHGHNYDLLVEVEGDLTDDAWVLDFGELKSLAEALCQQLDHRLLLPRDNPALTITDVSDAWQIVSGGQRYVIPKSDVCVMPLDNSTAERLAEWFCQRLADALAGRGNVNAISVGVEEAPGQAGWCTLSLERPLTWRPKAL